MFSDLTEHFNHPANSLYALKNRLMSEGRTITDLTSGNVTQHGIHFPKELLREALAEGAAHSVVYAPNPLGQLRAREAISRWYAAQGTEIPPDQLVLTPGTSLSYWYAFQLLANPGDEILCPSPNYPLFDSIARMSGVRITHYPLDEEKGWRIDLDALEKAITKKTRAIVVISPHNPTGMVATVEELDQIAKLARDHRLPVIVDEVFASFLFRAPSYPRPKTGAVPLLVILNGFSKMLALAGLKIGWMGLTGDPEYVQMAMRGLDALSDTFLPVADPAQGAVPALLEKSADFQLSFKLEIARRAKALEQALQRIPGLRSPLPEGGFCTVAQLPSAVDEEQVALRLLERDHVLLHPGYFYDLEGNHVVMTHVAREEELRAACGQLQAAISALYP